MKKNFITICIFIISLNLILFSSEERRSSTPFISGDTFREYADHIYDETTTTFNVENVREADVVFLKTDYDCLEKFFSRYHPLILHPYIIVTHNSDHSTPGPFYHLLDSEKIIAWFGQNIEGRSHPKLFSIPIGIANSYWTHGNVNDFLKYSEIKENIHRPYLCHTCKESIKYS